MKTFKFYIIASILAILTFSAASCTQTDNLLGGSPQRAPQNSESPDYIMSVEEAMALVTQEAGLNDRWGLPSMPSYASIETGVVGDILCKHNMLDNDTIKKLIKYGVITLESPAYYKLNFRQGGYAVVLSNKRIDAGIVYVQNYDNNPNCVIPGGFYNENRDSLLIEFEDYDSFEDQIENQYLDWLLGNGASHLENLLLSQNPDWSGFGSGEVTPLVITSWSVVNTFETGATFFPKAYDFNMSDMDSLGECWQVLFSFLGYWEAPCTLFGQTGDWVAIKNDINTPPAPYWAKKMSEYCNEQLIPGYYFENPRRMSSFLANECSGVYTDVSIKQYSYDMETGYNNMRHLFEAGKPAIVIKDREPFLAVKETVSKRHIGTTDPIEEYKSVIRLQRGRYLNFIDGRFVTKCVSYIDYNN